MTVRAGVEIYQRPDEGIGLKGHLQQPLDAGTTLVEGQITEGMLMTSRNACNDSGK